MWLIAGLGNPGSKYALTRHNIGFMCLDLWAEGLKAPAWSQEHKALTCKFKMDNEQILLAKPQTFMNLSGESVQALMHFYKIEMDHLVVVHDEVDIPFSSIRIHKNRSPGGHNGIKSVSGLLGSADYARLRLGVGRPPHPEMATADFVLQKFSPEEQTQLPDFLNRSADALEALIFEGLGKASSLYNK